MRVHIYSQEIDLNPSSVQIVETTADTGRTYYGLRFYLHSAPQLHHAADDDDRSAVTFWLPGRPGRPGHTQAFADLPRSRPHRSRRWRTSDAAHR